MLMWQNAVQPDRPQILIQHNAEKMRFAGRIQTGSHNI